MNALLPLLVVSLAQPPAAALDCPAPIAAKGEMKGGPPLSHAFGLTNRSGRTLTITRVEAGCGCVSRTLSAAVLKPGESATLTLGVNTLTQPDGPHRWQAVVAYALDDPARTTGELALSITVTLSREVSVNPPQIGFSTTGEAAQSLAIADRREKPLRIVKAISTNPHLSAALGAAAGGRQTVHVKLAADAPAGQRDEILVLQTDDPAYPEFRVPVRINKKAAGQVLAAPEELSVRLGPGQEEVSALVQVRAPDGKTVRIAGATSDSAAVTAKFSPQAGPVATVRISVGRTTAAQPGSGRVTVRLAEPAGQEVVIPVAWTIAPKK